ncbi:MAG: hypothetical protein ACOX2L_00220 [Anaerolineae bacterium]|nr:hypothetical protein [Chloroflexota bacterium]
MERTDLTPTHLRTLAWLEALPGSRVGTAPQTLAALAHQRGLAPRTLREHLARLERSGLLCRTSCGRAGLALSLPPVAAPASGPPPAAPLRAPLWGPAPAQRSGAPAPQEAPAQDAGGQGAAAARPAEGHSAALLQAVGVYPVVARRLAQQPWVTPEVIRGWVRLLQGNAAVRNLAAVLVYRLQDPRRCLFPQEARRLPPEPPLPDEPGLRPRRLRPVGRPAPSMGEPLHVQLALDAAVEDDGVEDDGVEDDGGGDHGVEHAGCAGEGGQPEATLSVGAPLAERPPQQGREELDALWQQVRAVLVRHMLPGSDLVWLRRARPTGLEYGLLRVAVYSPLSAHWLNACGLPQCLDEIRQVVGRPLRLVFYPGAEFELAPRDDAPASASVAAACIARGTGT